jgi:hypothetical protein
MNRLHRIAMISAALAPLRFAVTAHAQATVKCTMTFNMSGWSAFYKQSKGTGNIKCSNGESAHVTMVAKGGGLTVGKSTIENGYGEFSSVHNLGDILGTYASAEAHAGAVKSANAQVMTKGEVSLALSGKGEGWDLGIAFGKLVIEKG